MVYRSRNLHIEIRATMVHWLHHSAVVRYRTMIGDLEDIFKIRRRSPPQDDINSMLSSYSPVHCSCALLKCCVVQYYLQYSQKLMGVGGFVHQKLCSNCNSFINIFWIVIILDCVFPVYFWFLPESWKPLSQSAQWKYITLMTSQYHPLHWKCGPPSAGPSNTLP